MNEVRTYEDAMEAIKDIDPSTISDYNMPLASDDIDVLQAKVDKIFEIANGE